MLTDKTEIEIASRAKQKNVRDPARSREHFFAIMRDFFAGRTLSGSYVDLGPGQFDFGEIARKEGGTCLGIDFDPAVVELGRYKGFRAIERNIQRLPKEPLGETFDGVFNKFTLNAFWTWDDEAAHRALIGALVGLMKPEGWCWIGPWNGVPKKVALDETTIAATLDLQRRIFEEHGFTTVPLTDEQSRRYGIHGDVANNVVFIRNLVFKPVR
ncbi:MAG: class I SAM-dependent methyltransferase [Hyphomicrobiaceae bacterium]